MTAFKLKGNENYLRLSNLLLLLPLLIAVTAVSVVAAVGSKGSLSTCIILGGVMGLAAALATSRVVIESENHSLRVINFVYTVRFMQSDLAAVDERNGIEFRLTSGKQIRVNGFSGSFLGDWFGSPSDDALLDRVDKIVSTKRIERSTSSSIVRFAARWGILLWATAFALGFLVFGLLLRLMVS